MMVKTLCLFSLLVCFIIYSAEAFYLPGVAPQSFADGEQVDLKVNKLRFSILFILGIEKIMHSLRIVYNQYIIMHV
jgi:hypothetical protein